MKKVLSLVIVIVLLMSSLVSCYMITRKANINDISYEIEDDFGAALGTLFTGDFTLNIQANEKITGLVLQVELKTEDDEVIKTFTINAGTVVPGNKYSYELDISDISLTKFYALDKYSIKVVDGNVVTQ